MGGGWVCLTWGRAGGPHHWVGAGSVSDPALGEGVGQTICVVISGTPAALFAAGRSGRSKSACLFFQGVSEEGGPGALCSTPLLRLRTTRLLLVCLTN